MSETTSVFPPCLHFFFFPALPDVCVTLSVNSEKRMKMRSNSLGSEQENTTKSQTNTTNQTPKPKTQARSLLCLGKCKLGEISETYAPLSAPQKFSSTSMYFSICPVLNVSHVNIATTVNQEYNCTKKAISRS